MSLATIPEAVAALRAGRRSTVDEVEEVVAGRFRDALRVQPVRRRPHPSQVGPPAAVQDPVHLRDVPAPLDMDAGADQRS